MKTLLLMRHAKSSWDDPSMDDFDRPLNKRGQKAAPLIGGYLKQRGVTPNLILCSPAKRTRQTAKLTLAAAGLDNEKVTFEERIYEASIQDLFDVLVQVNSKVDTVLLIGHNPGMAELLYRTTLAMHEFPTATLACVKLEIKDWIELKASCGKLEWIVFPRDLD